MNGDLHEWIFLKDFDERKISFLLSIFQDMREISNRLMIVNTKEEGNFLHNKLIYMIFQTKSTLHGRPKSRFKKEPFPTLSLRGNLCEESETASLPAGRQGSLTEAFF